MPEPIAGASASWYLCKFCPSYDFCHISKTTKQVNCRTCAHSTPKDDGTWHCARWGDTIPTEAQYTGCNSHVLHPDLVPWKLTGSKGDWSAVYEAEGRQIVNGDDGYHSSEIVANLPLVLSLDSNVEALRDTFGARVTG
jgi:hypothetical protein